MSWPSLGQPAGRRTDIWQAGMDTASLGKCSPSFSARIKRTGITSHQRPRRPFSSTIGREIAFPPRHKELWVGMTISTQPSLPSRTSMSSPGCGGLGLRWLLGWGKHAGDVIGKGFLIPANDEVGDIVKDMGRNQQVHGGLQCGDRTIEGHRQYGQAGCPPPGNWAAMLGAMGEDALEDIVPVWDAGFGKGGVPGIMQTFGKGLDRGLVVKVPGCGLPHAGLV